MASVVVHYSEIALKGRNRPFFVSRLVRNLREATEGAGVREVRPVLGRVELVLESADAWPEVRDRVSRVFGVGNFARADRAPADLDALGDAIVGALQGPEPVTATSFRIAARRPDKRHPITSPQIERALGARVQAATGWKVDLSRPDLKIHVDILGDEAFYFLGKDRGPGGLPSGVSGRVMCLLSGGIDSPVAAWQMMRRGLRVHFVHFHSYPILSRASQEKAVELARLLTTWQLKSRLWMVAFGEIQQKVLMAVEPALRVVVYRRLMVRIAEQLARRHNARALVTGEVVGQVASQTLENLSVIDAAARMPILRPLIGTDKEEITEHAQRLGSFPISIIPDQDCCTLFIPRHPATRTTIAGIEAAEAALDVAALVDEAARSAVVEDFHYPVVTSGTTSQKETQS